MTRARPLPIVLALALALGPPAPACAQDGTAPVAACPAADARAGEAAPEAGPRAAPKRRPTPKPKPAPKAAQPAPAPSPAVATPFAAPAVACDPGQAVRYDAPAGADLWVTRTGTITVDNPLRPLTPDTTRVLQVVVGGKLASAYGPDLAALRRGAAPAVLEGVLGGAIRWDPALAALPDPLTLVSDTGEPVAAMRFRACGEAPAARALPAPKAQRIAPPPEASAGPGPDAGGATSPAAAARPARRPASKPAEAVRVPRGFSLPQGAIP